MRGKQGVILHLKGNLFSILKSDDSGKKKQIKFRQSFYNRLKYGSEKVFDTEEEEYQFVCKFGRGMWERGKLMKSFDKNEMDTVVQSARDYGAFDY